MHLILYLRLFYIVSTRFHPWSFNLCYESCQNKSYSSFIDNPSLLLFIGKILISSFELIDTMGIKEIKLKMHDVTQFADFFELPFDLIVTCNPWFSSPKLRARNQSNHLIKLSPSPSIASIATWIISFWRDEALQMKYPSLSLRSLMLFRVFEMFVAWACSK